MAAVLPRVHCGAQSPNAERCQMSDKAVTVRTKVPFPRPPEWLSEYLEETYEAGPPKYKAPTVPIAFCRWCGTKTEVHGEHGLPCDRGCRCESSHTSRDDSWRPSRDWTNRERVSEFMDQTGCDGWVAAIACGIYHYPKQPSSGLVRLLLGVK